MLLVKVTGDMRAASLPRPKHTFKIVVLLDHARAKATPEAVVSFSAQVVPVLQLRESVDVVDCVHTLKVYAQLLRVDEDVMTA
jgi:hypothetical protein